MKNILKNLPGFRSGKIHKMIIAIIYYLITLLMFMQGFGYGLFYLSAPFLVFSIINLLIHKKKFIPLNKAVLNFIIPFVLIIVSMVALPDVETDGTDQNEKKQTEAIYNSVNTEKLAQTSDFTKDTVKDSTESVTENETAEEAKKETEEQATEKVTENETEESTEAPVKTNGTLEVHFIDVGQADASLVICDGISMLIDGGNAGDSSLIYSYLKKKGIDHLDYIINTHPHEDHVGGLAGALNYASVDKVIGSMTSYDSKAFNSFVKYLDEQNVRITLPKAGDTFKLASADVQVLGPVHSSKDINNNSIVLKITYGATSFLFTGDAEREEEQDILAKGFELGSTVLKVGHHGSDTSTTYPFLREIMPEYAVISAGGSNQYGHPNEDTLSRLRDADVKTYRTDMQGDIICISDGKNVSFTVTRNANVDTLIFTSKATPTPKAKPTSKPTSKPVEKVTEEPTEKATKKATQKATAAPTVAQKENPQGTGYILNTNSKKIHYPNCGSVKRMSEKNKQNSKLNRDKLISQGYDPCGNCKP